MSKNENRLNFRMTDETATKIERWYQEDNCRSKNEFIEKAVNCYADMLAAGESTTLPRAVQSAIDSRLKIFEDRIASLLYKQTQLIAKLAKDFPDAKELMEYEDYLSHPTKATASALITLALESNWDRVQGDEKAGGRDRRPNGETANRGCVLPDMVGTAMPGGGLLLQR